MENPASSYPDPLSAAEKIWLHPLYTYCKTLFKKKKLVSHDHTHHLRVWQYARQLLQEISNTGQPITPETAEHTINACFFHDAGMSETLEPRHGKVSRAICEQYFQKNPADINNIENVLNAIEKHDDKSYTTTKAGGSSLPADPLSVLQVADDLDALGAIGVFRYAEIYLLRNIATKEISDLVIENSKNRFGNITKKYPSLTGFLASNQQRLDYLVRFYQSLKNNDQDAVAVFEFFKKKVVNKCHSADQIIKKMDNANNGERLNKYKQQFVNELKSTKNNKPL